MDRVPPTPGQASFLVEAGENPDTWHQVDADTLIPFPRKDQCEVVLAQRCQRRKGHTGNHACSYYALGGVFNSEIWGEDVDRAKAKGPSA